MALYVMAKVDFDASSSELLGTDIGPYRLVRRLGMGGMAETFVAIRRGPSGFAQRVCLKLVLPFFREDEEFVKLFQREARLAAKLRHSNIVGVIDFGEIHGRSYMALELVDGVDLQVLLDAESGKRVSPDYVALIGHDLASALEHAHDPPRDSDLEGGPGGAIIHRDISPSNVLISKHGEIMLSDFGVAKAVTGASHKQSAVKGKIPYMSPEQLKLEQLDGRADLFGVGVVLYEALCGRRPYEGGHDPATIMLILQGDRQPLASLAPGAPPELCAIIDSLVEPDRDNRPSSATELIELLDPFVPAPRVRRQLGKRVDELRPDEAEVGASSFPPPRGDDDTALRGDIDVTDGDKQTSGIVGSGKVQPEVEPWSAGGTGAGKASSVPPPPMRRRRGLLGIGALLAGLVALGAAAFFFNPGDADIEDIADMIGGSPAVEVEQAAESAPTPSETPAAPERAPESELAEGQTPPAAEPSSDTPDPPEEVKPEVTANAPTTQEGDSAAKKPKRSAAPTPVAPAKLTVIVYPWGDVWINGKRRGSAPLKNVSLKPGRYKVSAGQGEPRVTQTIRLKSGETKKLRLDVTK